MRRYSIINLLCFLLTGVSMSVIASWQEGDFNGELHWQGVVTQTRNPWLWSQPALPDMPELDISKAELFGDRIIWRNILIKAPVFMGYTEKLMPAGRPGVAPVIQYGETSAPYEVKWLQNGIARVTLPVSGKGRQMDMKGSLTFTLQVAGAIVSTREFVRQGYSAVSSAGGGGNGIPPAGKAVTFRSAVSIITNVMGSVTPQWLVGNIPDSNELAFSELNSSIMRAAGGAYSSEIVAGSGELSFPANNVPDSWQVSLPIQVTYQ